MLLNILRAGPSLMLSIFTISDCVSNKKASPSICWKEKNAVQHYLSHIMNNPSSRICNLQLLRPVYGLTDDWYIVWLATGTWSDRWLTSPWSDWWLIHCLMDERYTIMYRLALVETILPFSFLHLPSKWGSTLKRKSLPPVLEMLCFPG